ncbi:MAG TPA: hypothetical protein VLA66_13705, partial [Thermoanaerobaculia bacterium]|nr:hypothetical protein [Thermoanaerobaculia bacterium]
MTRPADAIRHAALEPGRGERPERAEIPDRARLGVVLQAAGLLSLCEAAGWRPVDGLARARVDARGRLRGIAVEPGTCGEGCAPILLDLLLRLFRSERTVEGRGAARRAARQLVERWRGALHRPSADGAVTEILRVGPFLGGNGMPGLDEALEGVLVRGGREIVWRAGRGAWPDGLAGDPVELARRGRWRAAARAFRVRPPRDRAEREAAARSFYRAGRAEAALVLLGEIEGVETETLRATCRHALGELPAARESIRRLEAADLTVAERLEASDVALRVLSLTGERDAAGDWVARLAGGARGAARLAAELVAATAAGDRGELDEMERRLEAAAEAERRPELAERWHEVRTELAWERQQAEPMIEHGRRRLALGRRRMGRYEAGRAWNSLGLGLTLAGRFGAAERAFAHAARLLDGCDGPLGRTLAATNLADVRLRVGRPDGVETLLRASSACNRRSGNRTGLALDALLGVRLELVRGRLERALDRAADLRELLDGSGVADVGEWLALLEARALGWLGRAGEARKRLEDVPAWALRELEPEERPFLFALAGDTDRAVEAAGSSGLAGLVGPLVEGREPPAARWREAAKLEPYRRARLVLDAELASPGSAPGELREPAAELFRRLGAHRLAGLVERARTVAWRSLGDFFERPSGDRTAIEELLAAVGHAEA